MTMISYAQNREDVLLRRAFADAPAGFYVDVGANHPYHSSVTKHFYEHGWRGINIEPAAVFDLLRADRPRDVNLNIAVGDRDGVATIYEFPKASGLSTFLLEHAQRHRDAIGEEFHERQVPVKTLASVCQEHVHCTIDFMSVDVEGFEPNVLAGGDWRRFRPRIVLVEATLPNEAVACHEDWEKLLLTHDYLFAYFDGLNRFYVRAEDRRLADVFKVPVNFFDDYEIYEYTGRIERLIAEHQQERTWLKNCVTSRDAQIADQQRRLAELETIGRLPMAVARRLQRFAVRYPRSVSWLRRAGSLVWPAAAPNHMAGTDHRQLEKASSHDAAHAAADNDDHTTDRRAA